MDIYSTLLFIILHLLVTILLWEARFAKRRHRNALVVIAFSLYILFAGFRGIETVNNIHIGGGDMNALKSIFERLAALDIKSYFMNDSHEPLYMLVTWVSYHAFHSFRPVLFFFHTIAFIATTGFLFKIQVKAKSFVSFMAFSLIVGNLFFMFAMFRNSCAIAITALAFAEARNGKYIRAIVLVILASTIHTSAIYMMLYIFIIFAIDKIRITTRRDLLVLSIIGFGIVGVALYFSSRIMIYLYSPYYVARNENMAWRSYFVFFVFAFYGLIVRRTRNWNVICDCVCLFFGVLTCVIDFHFTISYRFVYLLLPIAYTFIIETEEADIKRFRLKKTNLFSVFELVYLVYRIIALYFWEIVSAFPYVFEL